MFEALADVPGVWIVGGAVRDALLGRDPRDLDLVVEGDAEAVARRLGEDAVVHDRFGTATAVGEVNIAATRRERYERPGALPDVELGVPLREDLERRDFSVNTLAVRLADGELEAVPGALEDLAGAAAAGAAPALVPRRPDAAAAARALRRPAALPDRAGDARCGRSRRWRTARSGP